MPDPRTAPAEGLIAAGGDLEPGTILSAYRSGIFPWPDREGRILWWSPIPARSCRSMPSTNRGASAGDGGADDSR